jgi:hypothetical protein
MDDHGDPDGEGIEAASVEVRDLVSVGDLGCGGSRITPTSKVARVGGDVEDPTIVKALATKAATTLIHCERKRERLRKEAASAARKTLQQTRTLENDSKKRRRDKETIASYFTRSRNFDAVAISLKVTTLPEEIDHAIAISEERTAEPKETDRPESDIQPAAIVDSSAGSTSSEVQIIASNPPPIEISSDSSTYCLSEDDPKWHSHHDVPVQESAGYGSEEEELPDMPPPPQKTKKNYDLTRKFQMEWSAKAPWSEMILTRDGLLHIVKCSVCTSVRGHPVIMMPKWDTVRRHGFRICHVKNTELYA